MIDIGIRLKNSTSSIVFKSNLHHRFRQYLIGIQHCIHTNLIVGLLAEEQVIYRQHRSVKFSLMSHWYLNKLPLHINTIINSENELGIALTYHINRCSLVLQAFRKVWHMISLEKNVLKDAVFCPI